MAKKENISKELSSVIRAARGDRSLRDYANDSDVSYMTVYKAEKGDYIPSSNILKKLASENAKPQNGVTYDDMMVAAGYQDENAVSDVASVLVEQMREGTSEKQGSQKIDINKEDTKPRLLQHRNAREEYQRRVEGVILAALLRRNIFFRSTQEYNSYLKSNQPDMKLDIEMGRIREWWFVVRYFWESKNNRYGVSPMNIRIALTNMLFLHPTKETKISIVVNNIGVYEYLIKRANEMPYRSELSVILVDEEKQEVTAEKYLSNYFFEDHGEEFYLV
jgi:hypothetical protein